MFDQSYQYKLTHRKRFEDGTLEEELIYSCKSVKNDRYIIRIEKYLDDLYIPKFHLKNHTNSDSKYKAIINKGYANRILNTCLVILLDIYNENSNASFLIHGMNSDNEPLANTKRYRIYKLLISSKFSTEKFHHTFINQKSLYALINKRHKGEEYFNRIESRFQEYFENHELLSR